MKLVKFIDGTAFVDGPADVPVWINVEAIASVRADSDPSSKMTLITTQDGKEHRVQGVLATIVAILQRGF
jgi:hypothetical protein